MADQEDHSRGDTTEPARFTTTHWSVVARAGQADWSRAKEALSELCRVYWYPLYCLVRGESALPYAEIAVRLHLTEAAVKMAVQRLRARYRELLREEIGKTVASPDDVEAEIQHLFAAFRG